MNYTIRLANTHDEEAIYKLYKAVSQNVGGIARQESEITSDYIKTNLEKSILKGICLVIENLGNTNELIAEIHCYKPEPKVFSHVLSDLTIVVHPNYTGKGIGHLIFSSLLNKIETDYNTILRVELIARESNLKAIKLYQSLGFVIEGKFEKRIKNNDGSFEADIPMAWINKNFNNMSVRTKLKTYN